MLKINSWKKFWFQVASCVGIFLPIILLIIYQDYKEVLSYYKVLIPVFLGVYVYGKKVDNSNK